jgi:hypothetical protein
MASKIICWGCDGGFMLNSCVYVIYVEFMWTSPKKLKYGAVLSKLIVRKYMNITKKAFSEVNRGFEALKNF